MRAYVCVRTVRRSQDSCGCHSSRMIYLVLRWSLRNTQVYQAELAGQRHSVTSPVCAYHLQMMEGYRWATQLALSRDCRWVYWLTFSPASSFHSQEMNSEMKLLLFNPFVQSCVFQHHNQHRSLQPLFLGFTLPFPFYSLALCYSCGFISYLSFNFLSKKIVIFLHGGLLRLYPVVIQMTVGCAAMNSSTVSLQCGCITRPQKATSSSRWKCDQRCACASNSRSFLSTRFASSKPYDNKNVRPWAALLHVYVPALSQPWTQKTSSQDSRQEMNSKHLMENATSHNLYWISLTQFASSTTC